MNNVQNDFEVLEKFFKEQECMTENEMFIKGVLVSRTETVQEPVDVLRKIRDFGGEGWLQTASKLNSKVFVIEKDQMNEIDDLINAANQQDDSQKDTEIWVVEAEFAKEKKSLHVHLFNDEWKLVRIEEKEGSGIIRNASFLKRKGGRMNYQVEYSLDGNYWKKKACRFTGFDAEGGI